MSFKKAPFYPPEYSDHEEDKYDKMIYVISKLCGITWEEAEQYTELDYYKSIGFNNLDIERQEFIDSIKMPPNQLK